MTIGEHGGRQNGRGAIVDIAFDRFIARFGRPPRWLAAAPGRMNLIGEHTDYNDGLVLPIAIDRWAVIAAAPAGGATTTLVASDLDAEYRFDGDAPDRRIASIPWVNYILGVINEFRSLERSAGPLDLLLASSVPVGAGLSSSAAIEVAMATMLESATGHGLTPIDKAKLCQRAEHAFAGTPCGIMDMLISCCGVADHAMLIDCRDLSFAPVPMPPPDQASLLVVNTGVKHDLATSEYAERRASCASAAAKLGLPSLRDATLAMLDCDELTEIERKRCSHVITENTRTLLAARALQEEDCETLGDLMFAGHESLRELFAVSCPELDVIVNAARILKGEGAGVFGARMTGGGFGGSAIVLCEPHKAMDIEAGIQAAFQESFGREPSVGWVRAVGGVESISPVARGR